MSTTLLKRAVLVKEVSHEYQRQSLLATAWRIEELKRYIEFMEGVQEEIKNSFGDPSEKLTLLESILSQCSLSELRDERSKLLNTYDVDVSKLVAIDSQLGRPGGTASRLKPRRLVQVIIVSQNLSSHNLTTTRSIYCFDSITVFAHPEVR
ncbi:hypothetical protein J3A83DRAFT_420667 [Scleroderma citrinum]